MVNLSEAGAQSLNWAIAMVESVFVNWRGTVFSLPTSTAEEIPVIYNPSEDDGFARKHNISVVAVTDHNEHSHYLAISDDDHRSSLRSQSPFSAYLTCVGDTPEIAAARLFLMQKGVDSINPPAEVVAFDAYNELFNKRIEVEYLDMLTYDGAILNTIHPKYLKNRSFAEKAIALNPLYLPKFSHELTSDTGICEKALRANPAVYAHLSPEMKKDKGLALIAVSFDRSMIEFVPKAISKSVLDALNKFELNEKDGVESL